MLFDKSINGFADQFALTPAFTAGESDKLASLPTGWVYLRPNHLSDPQCIRLASYTHSTGSPPRPKSSFPHTSRIEALADDAVSMSRLTPMAWRCATLLSSACSMQAGSPLPEFTFHGVALHPLDLTHAPTQQLIHPSIEDPLEINQVMLAALLGGCGCS